MPGAARPDDAFLFIHRHARKIADVLVGTGKLIEQCCFAAVLIACECENHENCLLRAS